MEIIFQMVNACDTKKNPASKIVAARFLLVVIKLEINALLVYPLFYGVPKHLKVEDKTEEKNCRTQKIVWVQ